MTKRRAENIPGEVWEEHRGKIVSFYQSSTLEGVIQMMSQRHGFNASKSQYTRKFKEWGKATNVILHGNPISQDKLEKEIARYVSFTDRIFSTKDDDDTSIPDGFAILTPPATMVFPLHNRVILIPSSIFPTTSGLDSTTLNLESLFELLADFGLSWSNSTLIELGVPASLGMLLQNVTRGYRGTSLESIYKTYMAGDNQVELCTALDQSTHSNPTVYQLFSMFIFMVTNDLRPAEFIQGIYIWVKSNSCGWIFTEILKLKSTTIDVFATKLFPIAVHAGDVDMVRKLLSRNVDIETPIGNSGKGEHFRTALSLAVGGGNMQMVKVLCELGAIPAVLEIDSMVVKDTHASLWSPENTGMLRLLLDYGAAPECLILDGPRGYPLVKAASEGSVEAVSLLLALGANVNSSIPRRWGTALQASVAGGHIQVVRALLKAEADVNMIDMVVNNDNRFTFLYGPCDAQQTPIQLAAKTNNTEMVLLLLRSGALVNLCPILPVVHVAWIDTLFSRYEVDRSSEGTLPLAFAIQYAAQNENVPLVHQLLAAGAMVDSRIGIDYGSMPLQIAARLGNMELISLFLAYDADVNAPPEKYNGRTAIQAAAENGNIEVIQMLLDSHANVHALPGRRRGRTALQAALEKGNINAARHLLLSGADINSKPASSYGLTALQAAVSFGDIEIVTELLSYGADANAEAGPKWGLTALQAAVRKRSIDLLGLLLGAGADVNALSSNFGNMTALQFAVSIDWLEGVKLLLNYKPDVRMIPPFYQENYKAFSALGWAIQNFNLDMIALLFDHGAGPNDPVSISPDEPPTAFLYALSHSKRLYLPEIIELFVKNGADICQCWGSKSSLEVVIAVSPANVEVIRIIIVGLAIIRITKHRLGSKRGPTALRGEPAYKHKYSI
ncbi:hypothetical protein TMatcc_002253 [Talaromyces marneffei ATCC 18224]